MIRVMVDIECLDVGPTAVVSSVGLATFDYDKILSVDTIYIDYSRDTGSMSPSTLRWWLSQDSDVFKKNLFGATPMVEAATAVTDVLRCADEIWANSPTFDCIILRNWFERLRFHVPWHFRQERCCRTIFAIGRRFNVPWPANKAKHDAGEDARTQAQYVLNVEKVIWST